MNFKTKIFMNIYSDEVRHCLEDGYIELNNLENSRKDWFEYWPIRKHLIENKLEENCFYGFFSPRFYEKTGLRYQDVLSFIETAPESVQVITFSPQPDIGAFFKNVFIGAEFMDHGFMKTCQILFERIGLKTNLDTMINDSRTIVFSNYFVAKPAFWTRWFETCEKIFQIAEGEEESNELVALLRTKTNYREGTERKVFIIERIASLLLTLLDKEQILNYDPFKLAWSLQLGDYKNEAVICDALKIASNENGFEEFEQAFNYISNSTLIKALSK